MQNFNFCNIKFLLHWETLTSTNFFFPQPGIKPQEVQIPRLKCENVLTKWWKDIYINLDAIHYWISSADMLKKKNFNRFYIFSSINWNNSYQTWWKMTWSNWPINVTQALRGIHMPEYLYILHQNFMNSFIGKMTTSQQALFFNFWW